MTSAAPDPAPAFDLLAAILEPPDSGVPGARIQGSGVPGSRVPGASGSGGPGPAAEARRSWLPTAGTLPGFSRHLGGHPAATILTTALRSLGQVIFINNPLSGLLLLLALLAQSSAMGLCAALGIAAANVTARLIGCDRGARRNGIYGFNGALVGSAVAAFARLDAGASLSAWLLLVAAAAALTTLLVETLGRWLVRHFGLPPLTLPFCLVSWLLLAAVAGLGHPALQLAGESAILPPPAGALALLSGVVRGFGQVFLCPSLTTAVLVLAAVAAASPLACLLGLAGGLVGSLTASAIGMDPAALALGLGSYNGVLIAIAIGGTFHATIGASVLIALLAAAAGSMLMPFLAALLAPAGLPVLTLPFVLTTMVSLLVVRRGLPSLLPVALHSLLTPEEHRHRYRVARSLLGDFRRQLRRAVAGERRAALGPQADPGLRSQLQQLFDALDRDGDGSLSLAELAAALLARQPDSGAEGQGQGLVEQLGSVLQQLDLDGDGRVDGREFSEVMLRLRRLQAGHGDLLTYLGPVDANHDDLLDPPELDRLLSSVGQPPLQPPERRLLFGSEGRGLPWGRFIDQLLLT